MERRGGEQGSLSPTTELVHEVYTYGAPATRAHPFSNAGRADGCFKGLRSFTEDRTGFGKMITRVDFAAMSNFYPHAQTSSLSLRLGEDSLYTPCNEENKGHPHWPQRGPMVYVDESLHQENDYVDRLKEVKVNEKAVSSEEPFRSARHYSTLAFRSYDTTQSPT